MSEHYSIKKDDSGYIILNNPQGLPLFCKERTPVELPTMEKGALTGHQNPGLITFDPPTVYCGSHCPFFVKRQTGIALMCRSFVVEHTIDEKPL